MNSTTHSPKSFYRSAQFIVGALIVLGVALPVNNRKFGEVRKGEDIYYIHKDAQTIAQGQNPYTRTLSGNMKDNDKYATYFPLFYELGAIPIALGMKEYRHWLMFWQVIMAFFLAGCGFLLFHMLRTRTHMGLALFFLFFFFFHRWIINIGLIAHIDLIAVFFLLLSLSYLEQNFKKALLWFGVSLAIKQIAIFLAPLYLVWAWHRHPGWKYQLKSTLIAASVPLVVSLPFLLDNFKAFVYSVLFSATRRPVANFEAKSFDALVGMGGLVAKLPMLGLMTAAFVLAYKKIIGPYTSVFMVMMIFVGYNSVFFKQYFAWTIALLPLVMIDVYQFKKTKPQEIPAS